MVREILFKCFSSELLVSQKRRDKCILILYFYFSGKLTLNSLGAVVVSSNKHYSYDNTFSKEKLNIIKTKKRIGVP